MLFVQVAFIHLLQNQHLRQTEGEFVTHTRPQEGKLQPPVCRHADDGSALVSAVAHSSRRRRCCVRGDAGDQVCLVLVSFAGWAVSLCLFRAAVQTHAKLTTSRTVVRFQRSVTEQADVVFQRDWLVLRGGDLGNCWPSQRALHLSRSDSAGTAQL